MAVIVRTWIAMAVMILGGAGSALAKKTNQAVYEEPFDLAAGGASLTRASQEGVMFANPALMPYGEKFHRWLGVEFSLFAAKDYVDFARNSASGQASDLSSDELIEKAAKSPLHFGTAFAVSYITSHFGLALFGRFEPDVEVDPHGDAGLPAMSLTAEAYAGAVTSFAVALSRYFAIGVTGKYLWVAEPDITAGLSNTEAVADLANDPKKLLDAASFGQGMGVDVGALLFLQGRHIDYRLALKVDDVGDTQFTDSAAAFKQTMHAGVGITLHGETEALHLSADYRDLQGVYGEKPFKRTYLGAKLLLRNYLGLAAGYYQGIPTFGVRADLIFIKLGLTAYGRELGDYIEDKQRNLYVVYLATGF